MLSFQLLASSSIFLVTLASGCYPFFKRFRHKKHISLPKAEALASGVFLGAGLIHMLGESAHEFYEVGISYPVPFMIAGGVFLLFLLLEHIAKELYHHGDKSRVPFAIVATLMLSIHGFLAGSALGLSSSYSLAIIVFVAILAHKWAESFALALQITGAGIPLRAGLILFLVFSLMTPLGIFSGSYTLETLNTHPLLEPTLLAFSSGTFIYLGSLHGLEKSILITECCNLRVFLYVIAGFSLMAAVGLWA